MKTKPCLFLILLLFSILSPLGSFAQTDKFTASWTFKTASAVTNAVVNCSESSKSVYVHDDANDGVFMQVQAKSNVITATEDMLLPKKGVVLKIPVNKAGDIITVTKNTVKKSNYLIGNTIENIDYEDKNYRSVQDQLTSEWEYTADEWDAGVGYVEIVMKNDDNEFIKISVEMTKKTAYTYYDESTETETFYFLYDENKYTHDPKFVANLNSQCCMVYDNDGYIEHIYDTPHWNLSGYKKVVLTDAFINYTKSDAGKLKSCEYWFYGCDLANIEGLQNLNTSDVEDMRYMFANCTCSDPTAASTAFKNFDTRNVLDMGYMFAESFSGCENIDLDLSSFVAPKVTNLLKMFLESNIRTVDLSNFGGASVVEMRRMFSKCYSLESIDLSNWKSADGVSALTEYMFACIDGESHLETVKLGKLNLSGECQRMFSNCKHLKSVDMSQVNGDKIYDMEYFFENCVSLKDLDVSGSFNFMGDESLLPISLQGVFMNCKSLECLDLRTWKTTNVVNLQNLFTSSDNINMACENLNTVFVSDGWSTESEKNQSTNVMLKGCVNLIGGNGFTYDSIPLTDDMTPAEIYLETSVKYAHPDEEDNPGLFTYAPIDAELKYKIFYDLNGGKLPEGKSNPKEFAENDEVTLVNPEKEGYVFAGWTGTSATGLSADIPTEKDITIKKGSRGNRWYYAHWETGYSITFDTKFDDINIDPMLLKENAPIDNLPELSRAGYEFKGWKYGDNEVPKAMPAENITLTAQWEDLREPIEAELNGEVSFPASADNYCNGSEKTVTIDFKITRGEASEFKLSFPNDVIPAVNGTIEKKGEGSIVITIPDNIESGVYTGKVLFVSANPEMYRPFESTITITANIPRPAAVQLYTDMLLADNHDGNFASYQWYKDGNAISGATLGHYYEATLSGKYTVKITTTDGKEFMSCPVKLVTAKALKQSVKVYPNPAKKGETLTIEIENYTDGGDYTIKIFSSNGSLVKQLTAVSKTTQIALPSGIYSGSLINGGEKSGFKLIVK